MNGHPRSTANVLPSATAFMTTGRMRSTNDEPGVAVPGSTRDDVSCSSRPDGAGDDTSKKSRVCVSGSCASGDNIAGDESSGAGAAVACANDGGGIAPTATAPVSSAGAG